MMCIRIKMLKVEMAISAEGVLQMQITKIPVITPTTTPTLYELRNIFRSVSKHVALKRLHARQRCCGAVDIQAFFKPHQAVGKNRGYHGIALGMEGLFQKGWPGAVFVNIIVVKLLLKICVSQNVVIIHFVNRRKHRLQH